MISVAPLRKLRALKRESLNQLWRNPLLLAAACGLLLAAAFPKIGLAGAAWFAPGLILLCGLSRPQQAFRTGYVAGLVFHLASLYWLLNIPVAYAPVAGWLALSAYLALFPAVWVWLCCQLCPFDFAGNPARQGDNQTGRPLTLSLSPSDGERVAAGRVRGGPRFALFPAVERGSVVGSGWSQRLLWALACAAVWVALEMVQGRLFTGFPWNFLGASQYRQLPVIQIAAVTGIYGVSFLLVWFSAALACALAVFRLELANHRIWRRELLLPVLVIIAVVIGGFGKIRSAHPGGGQVTLALVQPGIPQTFIWDASENTNRFNKLLELSALALETGPQVLVWPEAALPVIDEAMYRRILDLVRTHKVWLIFGADDSEPRVPATRPGEMSYFNSGFLMNPAGEIAASYRKRRLVVFGEYVPLADWLPFLKWFTPIEGGFTPGDRLVAFQLSAPLVKMSPLICFEDVFPHLAREGVEEDTDFLLNLTNNGWFGESAAQWQHAASAVFRAVENGRPLVRCTNNGLTCWVDQFGGLHEIYFGDSPDIYGAGFKTAKVPLLPPGEKRALTFYGRHGDWFGWSCVGLAVVFAAPRFTRARLSTETMSAN